MGQGALHCYHFTAHNYCMSQETPRNAARLRVKVKSDV